MGLCAPRVEIWCYLEQYRRFDSVWQLVTSGHFLKSAGKKSFVRPPGGSPMKKNYCKIELYTGTFHMQKMGFLSLV